MPLPNVIVPNPSCSQETITVENTAKNIDSTVWELTTPLGEIQKINGTSYQLNNPTPGEYTLKTKNYKRCLVDSISKTFTREPIPSVSITNGNEQQMCKEETVLLSLESNAPAYWNNEQETILITSPGEYTATVANTCGENTATVTLEEEQIIIPNIITPNGDNKNDYFKILTSSAIGVDIYNRNGGLSYQTKQYNSDWPNGYVNPGTYYYKVDTENKCVYKGWLEIKQ